MTHRGQEKIFETVKLSERSVAIKLSRVENLKDTVV